MTFEANEREMELYCVLYCTVCTVKCRPSAGAEETSDYTRNGYSALGVLEFALATNAQGRGQEERAALKSNE